ncbi:MAG TPA: hypothetical protein VI408_03940 [Gaiellaceae bacterium]
MRRLWLVTALAALAAVAAAASAAAPALPCTDPHETLCGDGGPAGDARLLRPLAVTARPTGGFLVADAGNDAIRSVSASGVITTVAGIGSPGYTGDGGPAIFAQLQTPNDVTPRAGGGFFVADTGNGVIRRVLPNGKISTVAGGGTTPPAPSPVDADTVALVEPRGVAALAAGGFLIADTGANAILRVTPDDRVRVVAGTGAAGYSGDGGPATNATMNAPTRVLPEADGAFLVLDQGNGAVRRVSASGVITSVRGGETTLNHDLFGQLAVNPGGLAEDAAGDIYVFDDRQVVKVAPNGSRQVIAGTGDCGSFGDGGPAANATFATPTGLALVDGGLLVADYNNQAYAAGNVRLIAANGTITSAAGKANDPGCVGAGGAPTGALWPIFYITAPRQARRARPIAITFASTVAAQSVRTSLWQGSHRIRSVTRPGKLGMNVVTLAPGVPSGVYTMEIKAAATLPDNNADGPPTVTLSKRFKAPLVVRR